MRFADPILLSLLVALPLVWWALTRRRWRAAIVISDAHAFDSVPRGTWRVRLAWVPTALRLAALALLIFAIARPQEGLSELRVSTEGVAIQMVVDRSKSMEEPMSVGGALAMGLDVVKRVFAEFVEGAGDLPGRPNDMIGLVAFARFAETVCPLVRQHDALVKLVESMEIAPRPLGDRTAVGDAIALGAARLRTAEEDLRRSNVKADAEFEIKSKILILLTDGQSNAGDRTPIEAAELAAEWGIKIYAIGVGPTQEQQGRGFFARLRGSAVDSATLTRVAERTGGRYFEAGDAESLRDVYREIDALETTRIESVEYTDYAERFVAPAALAAALVALELALGATLFRRIG